MRPVSEGAENQYSVPPAEAAGALANTYRHRRRIISCITFADDHEALKRRAGEHGLRPTTWFSRIARAEAEAQRQVERDRAAAADQIPLPFIEALDARTAE